MQKLKILAFILEKINYIKRLQGDVKRLRECLGRRLAFIEKQEATIYQTSLILHKERIANERLCDFRNEICKMLNLNTMDDKKILKTLKSRLEDSNAKTKKA